MHTASPQKKRARSVLLRTASSDTEHVHGDAIVPDCDAWLDSPEMLSYTGCSITTEDVAEMAAKASREREAWLKFKNDIIRIVHMLKLKGWRHVEPKRGDSITVRRLSGAMTNAVYVVAPESDLPEFGGKKPPPQVLLRLYGLKVKHLIDRDNELKVLQRLARKKIGPRLLGTFKNGRFEKFFHAATLRPLDLREPDTSRQIARRLRELHEGIDLIPQERDNGPGVCRNWDNWLDKVARITTYLDQQLESMVEDGQRDSIIHTWKANGYVCGVPWPQFRDAVAKYRTHLNGFYEDPEAIKERLVFAHNDTQYGNILRLRPDVEKSPLLQASNKHNQLLLIDFEYAGANLRGLEFANHFTEWTYNYHHPIMSHACNTDRYPSPGEQRRFIKAYVDHQPHFPTASSTPHTWPVDDGSPSSSSSNINTPSPATILFSSSIIDLGLPGGWRAAENDRDEGNNQRLRELMEETRLWRPANSAQWIAWGIAQAIVPGLNASNGSHPKDEALKAGQETAVGDFDYLSYAQGRELARRLERDNLGVFRGIALRSRTRCLGSI